MTLPHVQAGEVARAAEQNDLISAVNGHTSTLAENGGTIGGHTTQLSDHANRIGALEAKPSGGSHAGAYFGQWTDDKAHDFGLTIDSGSGNRIIDLDYAVGTPVGCSLRAGTFTPGYAGLWMLAISIQYAGSSSVRAIYAAAGNASTNPSGAKLGLLAGPTMDAQSTTVVTRLDANSQLSMYAATWQSGTPVRIWRAHGNNVTAVWLGP